MSDKKTPSLLGVQTEYLENLGNIIQKNTQNITQDFMDDLKDSRNASDNARERDCMRVASIPTAVAEQGMG